MRSESRFSAKTGTIDSTRSGVYTIVVRPLIKGCFREGVAYFFAGGATPSLLLVWFRCAYLVNTKFVQYAYCIDQVSMECKNHGSSCGKASANKKSACSCLPE